MYVALFYGGPGSEHDVSVASAKNISAHIDRSRYNILEVFVTKTKEYVINMKTFQEREGLEYIKNQGIDIVLPIIHGTYGEDGELQKRLEEFNLPYVGCSSAASLLTINKQATSELLEKHGVLVPKSIIVTPALPDVTCTYPIVVKPVSEGSSVDLHKFENEKNYQAALPSLFKNHESMIVQEFVKGREFTCGAINKYGTLEPLVATEIILTKGDLFDYTAKYTPSGCTELTPAPIEPELMKRIQDTAIQCHTILGCNAISRTDLIVRDGDIYVLEINTVPGMTGTSFIPQQAEACEYSMKELLTVLIETAYRKD